MCNMHEEYYGMSTREIKYYVARERQKDFPMQAIEMHIS